MENKAIFQLEVVVEVEVEVGAWQYLSNYLDGLLASYLFEKFALNT